MKLILSENNMEETVFEVWTQIILACERALGEDKTSTLTVDIATSKVRQGTVKIVIERDAHGET